MEMKKKLRSGYTTGTCAAAAAGAAADMVFTGRIPETVSVALPDAHTVVFPVAEARCEARLSETKDTFDYGICAIKKDAGDDPDVTDGVLIYAAVSRRIRQGAPWDKPCYFSGQFPYIYLTGGEGIGIVTKEGLPCEPGFYAINPVPRRMIMETAADVCRRYGMAAEECLLIELSVPGGAARAEKTFNARLGILGGISILGTSGIVNPMSEQALLDTIRLEIRVRAREGKRLLAVAPGNYGEDFLKNTMGISMESFVKCSNFFGDTFQMLREEGIREAVVAGHIGKLIKVAGGVLNTHSAHGDRRMEILSRFGALAGLESGHTQALQSMNTTEEAVAYLAACGCLAPVMKEVLSGVKRVLEQHSGVSTEVIIFSGVQGVLGMTDGASDRIDRLKEFT